MNFKPKEDMDMRPNITERTQDQIRPLHVTFLPHEQDRLYLK